MPIASFDGYTIPYVHAITVNREFIGERNTTAGGKLRQDAVNILRTWELESRPMKKSDADNLINYLEGIQFASGDFYLDEIGSTVPAYIIAESLDEETTEFEARDGSGWQSDGRTLTMQVQETGD